MTQYEACNESRNRRDNFRHEIRYIKFKGKNMIIEKNQSSNPNGDSPSQEGADQTLSKKSLLKEAKARLTSKEILTYSVLMFVALVLVFISWRWSVGFASIGIYLRHRAIANHHKVVFRERWASGSDSNPKAQATRKATIFKRVLFWVFVAWGIFGVCMLLFSIAPGMSVEKILGVMVGYSVLFFAPAYFACRKLEPSYTLNLLFSSQRRTEFRAYEKKEKAFELQRRMEDAEIDRAMAEQEERDKSEDKVKAQEVAQRKQEDAAEKAAYQSKIKQRQEEFLLQVRSNCSHEPVVSTILGGSGFGLAKGDVVLVTCQKNGIALSNIEVQQELNISYSKLINAEVTGPGTEKSDAGFIGGGFGPEGAVKGILIASVINALTSKRTTNTFLRLSTSKAEVHLHISSLDPAQLRLILSPAFVQMEANRQIYNARQSPNKDILSNEIKTLHQMHRDGTLSDEEFTLAKRKVLMYTADSEVS